MRIKQSICYPILDLKNLTLAALFEAAYDIGYVGADLWYRGDDFERVAALARKHNLTISCMVGHGTHTDGLNKRSNHERIEGELIASIDLAARHGIPSLFCMTGNRVPYQSEIEGIEAVADGLRRVAPYAETKGINLCLEMLNTKVDHPGYLGDHTAWGVAVCERVNSPRVKLVYDIYHMQIMEGDVIRTLRENIRWIGHIHTAGVPGRHELDDHQELNYAGICRAIAATAYDGYVVHEFMPRGDIIEAYRQAFAVCDQG